MRYVYKISNLVNGKVYVGQTKNPAKRKAGHFYAARVGNLRPLYASIRKHGQENFSFHVLEECSDDEINEREKYWISQYDSYNTMRGYNLTVGGSSDQHFDVDVIEQRKLNGFNVLKKLWNDPEFQKRQSKLSSERMHHLNESGNFSRRFAGHHHSDETKHRIGAANSFHQKGTRNSQYGTTWIFNDEQHISRKVRIEELETWINAGWVRGRKMRWK